MNKEILESQNQTVAEEAIDRHNELSEKELESVAGGAGSDDNPLRRIARDAANIDLGVDSSDSTESNYQTASEGTESNYQTASEGTESNYQTASEGNESSSSSSPPTSNSIPTDEVPDDDSGSNYSQGPGPGPDEGEPIVNPNGETTDAAQLAQEYIDLIQQPIPDSESDE